MRRLALAALLVFSGCIDPIETDSQAQARRPDPAPPPRAPQESAPPPKSEETAAKLPVEPVDLGDADRKSHSVIVFAAEGGAARLALETHRSHKSADIEKLPPVRAGGTAALYLVWGHYPPPGLHERDVKATFDAAANRIRVTVPPFAHRKPGDGIGMDWGTDKNRTFVFVGFRAKLSTLPAGDYSYEVVEVDPGHKSARTLAEGTFTLAN